jgi:hypothetical protein
MKPPAVDTHDGIGRRVCAAKASCVNGRSRPARSARPSCWHSATPAERSCFEWPPLWRIDCLDILGRIVRPQTIQPQPFCLAAYRPARAMQLFDKFRHRVCRPQGDEFAKFLVGPTGHLRPPLWRPPARLIVLQIRVATSTIRIFSTWNTFAPFIARVFTVAAGPNRWIKVKNRTHPAFRSGAESVLVS